MCFYINLKKCREDKGLSQKEVAEMIGVAPSTYSLYEKGTREPPIDNIIEFMHIFGVSADYLLGIDHLIKVEENKDYDAKGFTNEELLFIEELRKDKTVYDILIPSPKRGADLIKRHLK